MQEIPARAALVSAPDVAEGLATSVSRDEVERAIRAEDGPLELILDVTRFSDDEAAETQSLAVSWERADLEQLLRQSSEDRVTLTFDGQAIKDALEADFDAHGMRERVLILSVAVAAAAGATAGAAAGQSLGPDDRAFDRSTPIAQVSVSPDDRAFARSEQPSLGADDRALPRTDPIAQPSLGPDDRAVPRESPAPTFGEPGPSPDDRAFPRMDPAVQPGLSPDDRAFPRTDPVSPGPDDRALPRESPAPTAQPSLSPDDRAFPRTDPVSQPSLGPDDRAFPRSDPVSQPSTAPSDDGTLIEAPSPQTIAVIGGIALAITGAAFAAAAASRRRPHPV